MHSGMRPFVCFIQSRDDRPVIMKMFWVLIGLLSFFVIWSMSSTIQPVLPDCV